MIHVRRSHRAAYTELLSPHGIEVVQDAPWGRGNSWLSVAILPDVELPARVRERLASEGIESRPVWKPMHRQPVFAAAEASLNGNADDLFARGLCLPSGSALTDEQAREVAEIVADEVASS
jgi:UDP-N-acetylbacillosamine transaminase